MCVCVFALKKSLSVVEKSLKAVRQSHYQYHDCVSAVCTCVLMTVTFVRTHIMVSPFFHWVEMLTVSTGPITL